IEYLETEELSAPDFVTHAFCTRRGGVSTGPYSSLNLGFLAGDRLEDVRRNQILVEEAFDVPGGRLILMRQVHGDRIRVLDGDGPLPEGLPECDGLITDRPGVALGIRTADCVPLFFVDRVRRVIGAAHAGWRGTAGGIAAAMVETLAGRFSSRREDLLAVIGPAIGPCCYQVDAPVFAAFSAMPGADLFLRPCKELGRWMVDLALANRIQIGEAGVPLENIYTSGLCTSCRQDLFFSHRAGRGRAGRQINLIMLRAGDDRKNA
ncbi:MAG: peptidoglycan editing factor PgeF, partial [Deltaproteobacteria bacterium]|nr:peptidoglycan editing factor PgeF [Deltaproteobacteria bacterium]